MAGEVDTSSGVAGRYATALFELALEQKALEQVAGDLNRFGEALDAFDDLGRLVKSPVFSAEEQGRALAAILEHPSRRKERSILRMSTGKRLR